MLTGLVINALFNDPNHLAIKKMMDATALRQEAIASNISNLETPNYKRIDIAPSFSAELARALGNSAPDQIAALKPSLVVDQKAVAENLDGNTVELETELLTMNQNTLSHSFQVRMLSHSFEELKTAITGRIS